jgi:hypothetical protein
MRDSFVWPTPDGAPDEILFRNVRDHGCHLMGIAGDAQTTDYTFSIGLYLNYGHPELVIFGVAGRDAAAIINTLRDRVAAGQTYAAGDVCDDPAFSCKLCFVEVPLGDTAPISARRSGSMKACGGRFRSCRSCGRTTRDTFPGKPLAIRG